MMVFVTSKSFGKNNTAAITYLQENGFEIRRSDTLNPTVEDIRNEIGDAEVLIVGNDPVDESIMQHAKNLKLIFMHGTGLDAIDVAAATKRKIFVGNTPGANKNAVAEMAVALMLTVGRRIDRFQDLLKQGYWKREAGHELSYSTIGIIGIGNIGKRIIELLSGFHVSVVGYDTLVDTQWAEDHDVRLTSNILDVFSEADYLILAAPLNAETENIVNEKTLSLMKKNAYIINTARGGFIDEAALCKAIKNKWIGGAALDTFCDEPLPLDSPLRELDIVLTPHIAATSIETSSKVSEIVARNIVAILKDGKTNLAVNANEIQAATII